MKNIYAIAFITVCTVFFACNKKHTISVSGPYTMQSVFSNMTVTPASFVLNASTGGTIIGKNGIRFTFPPFCFERDSVSITGNVNILISEYLKKSDMIFSGILPFSNDSMLITCGAYYISITQNGQPVMLTRPIKYQASIPQKSTKPADMKLFFGRPTDTIFTNMVNWQLNTDTARGNIEYKGDSMVINTDSTHYCAISKFTGNSNFQSVSITVTAPITTFSDSILAYVIYDGMNSIWQMLRVKDHVITDNMVLNLPAHLVVFSVINGDFYACIQSVSPVSGSNYSVFLTKSSPVFLATKIDAL